MVGVAGAGRGVGWMRKFGARMLMEPVLEVRRSRDNGRRDLYSDRVFAHADELRIAGLGADDVLLDRCRPPHARPSECEIT